jgi:glycine dehydrogenase subunit 1
MDYTQLTDRDVQHMLGKIGVAAIDELFEGIDSRHRLDGALAIPEGLSEPAMLANLQRLAADNVSTAQQTSFLGAGIYDHFIPLLVDALAMRSEFLTAYTPYQAEASQGVLQAFFEFQTMICQLTGMDVANASLYESASAAAEAVLMATAVNRRDKIVVAENTHPEMRDVLHSYLRELPIDVQVVSSAGGRVDLEALAKAVDERTSAVVVQQPNFFGMVEPLSRIADVAHAVGALCVTSVDPLSCGLLRSPGACGVDIVVGEGQGLGIPQSYGGPVLGLMACRQSYLRKMPGRLVGVTTDRDGRRAFCLTLQTREQHIRREKATSNVCTNQGLLAMRATVYMAAMGRNGIRAVARQCYDKAHYAASRIAALPGYELAFDGPFYQEFAVRCTRGVDKAIAATQADGILAGVALDRWFPQLEDCLMIAVTEQRTRADIDRLVTALEGA